MHLRSISMKGFKSFPGRTKLEFGPGVSVIVGPNGSGKSNITDAVLWALGEQSPLAVRGQSMKDVIFAGGHGVKGSSGAEVEVVIDNSGGRLESDFSELSIVRRLDRDGDGEYRLNGARCRLADVSEALSETGLGKEMHSVVSQGRVESIVLSRPRERRMLIEEAAGLGKHRQRRRRAQLKLERTEENLSRALDVEREARSRLRPLKRQAEAAELHERLERQSSEARYELARDALRAAGAKLTEAAAAAGKARAERDEAERQLTAVAERREQAEQAFAEQSKLREALQARLFAARSATERISMRLDRAREQGRAAAEGAQRRAAQLELLEREIAEAGDPEAGTAERIAELEGELELLAGRRAERLEQELAELRTERDAAAARRAELEQAAEACREALAEAERAADAMRDERRNAERAAEAARTAAAAAGAELAAVNQFLRSAEGAPGGARALSEQLQVEPGYELALAAALGPRLGAGVVDSVPSGERLLDGAGDEGGYVLVKDAGADSGSGSPPVAGAERLLDRVEADADAVALAQRLLAGVWIVDSLEAVPSDFAGVAVTRAGRVWRPGSGELRQAPSGGAERVLEQRNKRVELVAASESAVRVEAEARTEVERAGERVLATDRARDEAETALRGAVREVETAAEAVRRAEWLIEQRSQSPDEGPDAVRRAELAAEVRAERRLAESARLAHAERLRGAEGLRVRIAADRELATAADSAAVALQEAREAVAQRVSAIEVEHAAGAAAGERTAAELRQCAHQESELQRSLREASERVTTAEVIAQQARDQAADATAELAEVAERLGLEAAPATEPLDDDRRGELAGRIERLARRREQLGPVNPLAAEEYEQAIAHVEELEGQRTDLEGALRELQGLIRDTDRRIRESFEETFEAAAKNFEETVAHLFPGGRGRLRLIQPDQGPRAVLGGEEAATEASGDGEAPETEDESAVKPAASEAGVEIEVTPAGKSTKRLSLMSGGEKSLVALAFMFAVFLARPCPFYVLDEVEAALDDLNIDRFLQLVRRYSDRAQFIVVTHQKRTMDAADRIYGVSMGGDGISRVVSRQLSGTGQTLFEQADPAQPAAETGAAAGAA
ncbi:MAG TPA: AAA family ATPase [Thermoleophilaceae bacterium]|nr:AAA family ATPase [Thermoleophilaceae bacterium]